MKRKIAYLLLGAILASLLFAPMFASAQRKISELPAATTPLSGTEIFAGVQGGTTKKLSVNQIASFISGGASMAYLPNVDTALYGGTEIWLFKNNNGDTMNTGFGKFYNPKYDQSTPGFGIWDTSNTYIAGDSVIWGGKHWVSVAGGDGSAVDIFNLDSDWDVVPFNEVSYKVVIDPIEYDIDNDFIISRKEAISNNYVTCSFAVGNNLQTTYSFLTNNPIKVFQWGNFIKDTLGLGIGTNYCENSFIECLNYTGLYFVCNSAKCSSAIYDLTTDNISIISQLTATNGSSISQLTANNGSVISQFTIDNNGDIFNLTVDNGREINILTVSGISYDFLSQTESSYDLSGLTATPQELQLSFTIDFDGTPGFGAVGALTLPIYTVPEGYTLKNIAYNTAGLTPPGASSIINLGLTGAATSIFNDTTGDIDAEINNDLINVSSVIPSPAFLTTTTVGLVGEVKVNVITAGSLTIQLTYIML